MPTPYHHVLDAGDRLIASVADGDFDRAAAALDARGALIDALGPAPGPPPADLVERFRQQDARLSDVLRGGLRSLADDLAATGRTATAAGAYARPAPPAHLDTGRRSARSSQSAG
ncbi:hypothetical protein [Rubrivirga sp. IMCC43871]|uniref:hypothetical protein n=1 Tax=Rubrivirga sp. IMCC43871 TaxID=3391575 RepID=UPI00398FBEE0